MKVKLSILAAAALAATFGLSGCGGNEDPSDVTSTTPTPSASVIGVAVDGYLANATVWFDADGNESTPVPVECQTTTNAKGEYNISAVPASCIGTNGKIIIFGGIDLDTNATFQGVLKAPAGSKVTSPLTTLLADGMSATQIATILGIPETDISTDFRANNTVNVEVARAALQVQAVIGQITSIIAAENPALDKAQIMSAVVAAMTANVTSNTLLTDKTAIQDVINDAAQEVLSANISSSGSIADSIISTVTTLETAIINDTTIADVVETVADKVLLASGVYVDNSALTVAGQNTTFDQSGVWSDVNITAGTTNMSVSMSVINQAELSTTPKSVTLGVKIDDLASTRELKAILTGATVALDGSGNIVVTVPAGAVLYAEAMSSTSTTPYTASIPNAVSNIIVSSGGVLSVDLSTLLSKVVSAVPSIDFANLSVAGNYEVSFYLDGLTLGFESGTDVLYLNAPVETLSVIDGTRTMTGSKLAGKVNVQ